MFRGQAGIRPGNVIKRPMKTTLKASLLALTTAALPMSVPAAGLGQITVLSALGQPLRAEVELVANQTEREGLQVRVPGPDAFKQASVPYTNIMEDIHVSVSQRGGKPILKLSSVRPINEPFVQMLVELDWATGRLVRDFTFLLDPPAQESVAKAAGVQVVRQPAPSAATTSGMRKPAPAGASSTAATGDTHQIQKGETLHGIAAQTKPDGASLDQMLVAIFRKNPDAFDGNMNRMRAGRILKLPDAETVKAIAPAEARKEILLQSESFNAYRKRLATSAPVSEGGESRVSSGKIAPKVEETPSVESQAKDVVKVAPTPTAGASGADTARLRTLEADVAAREKALEEANSRIGELEKSIKDLQALLELRSRGMAKAEKDATAASRPAAAAPVAPTPKAEAKPELPPAPPPAEPPKAAEVPKAVEAPKADEAPKTEEVTKPAPADSAAAPAAPVAETPAVVPPKPKPPRKPAPEPVKEESFLDGLLANPLLPAAGGGLLVVLLGAWLWLKRKAKGPAAGPEVAEVPAAAAGADLAQAVFSTSGGQEVDTSAAGSSFIHTDFSQGDPSAIDTDEGVDPVAEADVYMAYGRDAQAEEILVDAMKTDPSRSAIHLKLLDIYAQRKDVKAFETTATELYALTGGKGDDWSKAALLGAKLDPQNPLYRGQADEQLAAVTAQPAVEPAPVQEEALEDEGLSFDLPSAETAVSAPESDLTATDTGLTFELPGAAPAPVRAATADEEEQVGHSAEETVLDFDLNFAAMGSEPVARAESEEQAPNIQSTLVASIRELTGESEPEVPTGEAALEQGLSFDFEVPSGEGAPAKAKEGDDAMSMTDLEFDLNLDDTPAQAPAALDLSDIDLELPADAGAAVPAPALEAAGDALEQVETKLELARAYEEMGDKEGAKELLDEVLSEGSGAQQEKARELLARLSA